MNSPQLLQFIVIIAMSCQCTGRSQVEHLSIGRVCLLVAFYTNTRCVVAYSGHYTINDSLVSGAPKVTSAPFKSTTERKMMTSPVPYPGPGAYRPFEETDKKPRKQGFL